MRGEEALWASAPTRSGGRSDGTTSAPRDGRSRTKTISTVPPALSHPVEGGERFEGSIRGEDVMTVREASDLLGITPRTTYRLVRDGKLPGARRLGRKVVIIRPVLEHWLLTGAERHA